MKDICFDFDADMIMSMTQESIGEHVVTTTNEEPPTDTSGSIKVNDLARAAEKAMESMKSLLPKFNSGTATRDETSRLESLNAKLSQLRNELEESGTKESEAKESEIKEGGIKEREAKLEALRRESACKAKNLMKTFKEREVQKVINAVCAAEEVDLAFIIDCTSSMQSYINSVKTNVKAIVTKIVNTNKNLNLRLSVVAYRDLGDKKRFEVMDFDSSVEKFESFISALQAIGGADAPEDIAGAFQQANMLSWLHHTRLAFLIADYPCHGTEFHNFTNTRDSYPRGTPGINIIEEIKSLLSKRIENGTMSLNFGRITEHTDTMIACFQKYGIDIDVVPVQDTNKMKASVTSSVRKSIFKTMTVTGRSGAPIMFAPPSDPHELVGALTGAKKRTFSVRKYSVVASTPSSHEWQHCTALEVQVYKNYKIESIVELNAPIAYGVLRATEKTSHSTMLMRRGTNPFAEGETRIAFHGQLARHNHHLPLAKNSMVMKVFKHIGKGVNDRDQYLKQMEVSNIARFLAGEFNKTRPDYSTSIVFLPVCVVEEEAATREHIGERRFCVEPPLPSDIPFQKYSNNTGYWNDDNLDETLLCFTMWTYNKTGGYLMVTDLQGVKKDNTFYLTDPAVLCTDITRFGMTNLGPKFMKRCIDATKSHMVEQGW